MQKFKGLKLIPGICLFVNLITQAQTLSLDGHTFTLDQVPIEMWGIRVASATQHDSLTLQLINQLDNYKDYGLRCISIYLQGSSGGYSDPFNPDGTMLDSHHKQRLTKIIEACAERDIVVIVGIFYQRVMSDQRRNRHLQTAKSVVQATKTVAKILRPYRNVIINIANEQNSFHYQKFTPFDFNNPQRIIDLCKEVKQIDPHRIVGGGGYHDSSNVVIGRSPWVDVLLFDTYGKDVEVDHHSGWHYDYYQSQGVINKPMINVEIFGGWTKRFTPPGVYPMKGKHIHLQEIREAKKRPGLWVHLHANLWCQGLADGYPIRYNLGGNGTVDDPGIRWWFEELGQ